MTTFITSQPLDNIATTSSEFGKRIKPNPSASSNHKGIDFPASKNTKVYASHSGIVVKAGSARGLGNVIVIKDSVTGKGTLYAHLNSLSTIIDAETGISETIKVGSSINSGTQIALSGNTGAASDGPHLHFAILDAKSVNKIKQNQTPTSLGAYSSELTWENPREHLAEAFPNTFSKAVPSGELGIDLTGDYRDNQMVGNRNNNNMYGLGGDDTYIFTTPFGSDQIIDSDFDGKIQINKVTLSGEAQPKTDKDGNQIEGQYSLNGYDLVRSGNDLVITKAGAITNLSKLTGDSLSNAIASVAKFIKQSSKRFIFFIISFFLLATNLSFAASADSLVSNHKYYYFTHKIIEKECKKFTNSCDYDKNSESQLHGNSLIIFYNKAILEQTNDYSTFYKGLKNGEYKIKTDKGTTISFESNNGEVIDLKILDGDLQKEKVEKSECAISPMLFNFYHSYSRTKEIMINDDSYIGGQIFKENKNPQKIRAIFFEGEFPVYTPDDNKKICKVIKGSKEYFYDMTLEGYENNKCEDYLILDKCKVILYKGKFKLPDAQ